MRHFTVTKIFCLCVLIAGLSGCADTPPPDQKTFDEGAAAFDAGDYPKAFQIFRDLADAGDIAALRNVALMERKGLGTGKNPQAAMADYLEAANKGLPTAQSDLAEMYLSGEAGDPDPKSALRWLERAVAANHPIAQFHLGELYEEGKVVPRDLDRAEYLYAAAAAHGVAKALERLSALKGFPPPGTPEPAPPPEAAPAQANPPPPAQTLNAPGI